MVSRGLQRLLLSVSCVLAAGLLSTQSVAGQTSDRLFERLAQAAPALDRQVLRYALDASSCAIRHGVDSPERLAVIDFSLPSAEKRMWIFDLRKETLLLRDLVAHGRNSGDAEATSFSNIEGSYQSSLGLFRAAESYSGRHGYSLRLDGLEPGVNDLARERAIVIHGADYVDPSWVESYGRIGRSLGCPAVRQDVVNMVVDNLKGGQLVFKYYPDDNWLQTSGLLNCDTRTVAGTEADAGQGPHRGS